MITSAIPKIILMLNDKNYDVKKWTSVTLFRIAEHHSTIILFQIQNLIPNFLQGLKLESKVA
jgi:hypothetical protein